MNKTEERKARRELIWGITLVAFAVMSFGMFAVLLRAASHDQSSRIGHLFLASIFLAAAIWSKKDFFAWRQRNSWIMHPLRNQFKL